MAMEGKQNRMNQKLLGVEDVSQTCDGPGQSTIGYLPEGFSLGMEIVENGPLFRGFSNGGYSER